MNISELIKNPIVFGAIVGVILCILLYLHDKLWAKPENKSGFATYFKIFLAGWVATAPLVWLFFNRNLSFTGQSGGSEQNIQKVVQKIVDEGSVDVSEEVVSTGSLEFKPKKVRGPKRCHTDMADW